jgi:hypothetical protein
MARHDTEVTGHSRYYCKVDLYVTGNIISGTQGGRTTCGRAPQANLAAMCELLRRGVMAVHILSYGYFLGRYVHQRVQ